MPPSGPSTAPDHSDASDSATVAGKRRHLMSEASPVRLSRNEPSRLVGALRYFTITPTSSENGMQITGNIQWCEVT